MKHRTVAAWEVFGVEPELAYDVCFHTLALLPDPRELSEHGAPPEVVQKARTLKEQRFVREEDRPRRFVLDNTDGLVTSRLEMEFAADFHGTWVTQRFSIHPHGFLARLLTAIPRRRLWRLRGAMQEQLRSLQSRSEERGFLISVHSPPQEEQQRRLRIRSEQLLAGFAYFEILFGDGQDSSVVRDVPRSLYENARFHLSLTGITPEDEVLRRIVEDRIHPAFERRLMTGDGASLSFFVDAFSYYMAWAKRLFPIDKDGLLALDAIARGDRETMGKQVLESLGPPEEAELARLQEKTELKPEHLLAPFARWLQKRQGAPVAFVRKKSSPPAARPVRATARRPSSRRVAEAERHYARGRALIKEAPPGDRAQAEQALAAFDAAAALLTRADGLPWGHLQMHRALTLMAQSRTSQRAQDVEAAIAACNEALTVFTRHEHPHRHGLAKIDRGRMMASRVLGPLRSNLEGAIADFQDAASVLTDHPRDWADAQVALARVLVRRPGYRLSTNVEEAIAAAQRALTVLDPEATPVEWAHAKVALGNAFAARSVDDPEKNLEASIEHLQAALAVFDRQDDPGLRGSVRLDLAASFLDRIAGPPADNVDKAIALLEEAVSLGRAVSDPSGMGHVWMSLGNAYMARRRGEPKTNFASAMEAFRKAAEGLRREDDRQLWAILQENLGHAWLRSPEGHSDETLRLAIAAFEDALQILTPLDDPRSWVLTQAGLGSAYSRLPESLPPPEQFVGNLDKAIAAYDAALTRAHREADPWKWAGLHKNRAVAYGKLRLLGEQIEIGSSFMESIDEESRASMEKALEVFTLERAPREHVTGALTLGMVHLRRQEWQAAEAAFVSVLRAADLLVGGIEVHDAEALDTLRSLGRLAADIPVPSLRLGDARRALALWESSRARLLAKALHLETLGLSAAERHELQEAKNEVSGLEHALSAGGRIEDRQALLERLAQRRRRMKEIVDPYRPPGEMGPKDIEDLVAACTRDGIVIVAPILTEAGSWVLLGLEENGRAGIRIVDLELEEEGGKLLEEALQWWLDEAARRSSRSRHLLVLWDMGAEPWEQMQREARSEALASLRRPPRRAPRRRRDPSRSQARPPASRRPRSSPPRAGLRPGDWGGAGRLLRAELRTQLDRYGPSPRASGGGRSETGPGRGDRG